MSWGTINLDTVRDAFDTVVTSASAVSRHAESAGEAARQAADSIFMMEWEDIRDWDAGHLRSAVSDFESAQPVAHEHVYLIPMDRRVDAVPPTEIARLGRALADSADALKSASSDSSFDYNDLRRTMDVLKEWIETVDAQMAANLEAISAMREAGVVAALELGGEIWQWCEGKGSHVQAAPEVFQRTVDHAGAGTSDAAALGATCTALGSDLNEALGKARSLRGALIALRD